MPPLEIGKLAVSIAAFVLSFVAFALAQRSSARAKRAEAITHLLGEKESVAFAALKLLRDGLPADAKHRQLVLAALLQACVFEGSDRARALLYRVIELNRASFRAEFQDALKNIKETFNGMTRYSFKREELDLTRGQRRLSVVETVINTP
jgi:hypothetical protein